MKNVVIATRNEHKVGEIRAILGSEFSVRSLKDLPAAPEVVEDAGTFAGNATKKAVALARWLATNSSTNDLWVLADDSGLEVDALGGAPGVHSARFAALDAGLPQNSSAADNNSKLLRLLEDVPAVKRTARFKCVLALTPVLAPEADSASPVCYLDPAELQTQLFEGVCEGRIATALHGAGGFGYDPLFFPNGYDQTFGELNEAVKNQLSHRARALQRLRESLDKRA